LCPGNKQPDALTGAWDRDLEADLDAVAAWGASVVVTLLERHVLRSLGVEGLPEGVQARGLAWHHLPIRDQGVPEERFERRWAEVGPELRDRLVRGKRLLVHCKGGLGRSGLVAARLLVDLGEAPAGAIARVRRARIEALADGLLKLARARPETP
jgi:ADP-ribosyl-[dinitrogen reductase] hydrolase